MKKFEITYTTDDPAPAYGKAIRKATDKVSLVKAIQFYAEIAPDALKSAEAMDPKSFGRFKKDLARAKNETDPKWCEKFNADWGDIIMPMKMLFSSLVADQFKVPWGCAYIRCDEEKWPKKY